MSEKVMSEGVEKIVGCGALRQGAGSGLGYEVGNWQAPVNSLVAPTLLQELRNRQHKTDMLIDLNESERVRLFGQRDELDKAITALDPTPPVQDAMQTREAEEDEALFAQEQTEPRQQNYPTQQSGADQERIVEFMQRPGAVKHDGGECPVAIGQHLEIFTRGCLDWPVKNIEEVASHWAWASQASHSTDILAYRLVPAPDAPGAEEGAKLGPPEAWLDSIIARGGQWHDGGPNPCPGWFVDIYVPAPQTNLGDQPNLLEGQPSDAYFWTGWEVAYIATSKMGGEANPTDTGTDEASSSAGDLRIEQKVDA